MFVNFALVAICIVGFLIAFRKLRLLQRRFDQLARDHDLLVNRVLLINLNRVRAEPNMHSLQETPARMAGEAETEIHGLIMRQSVPTEEKRVGPSEAKLSPDMLRALHAPI